MKAHHHLVVLVVGSLIAFAAWEMLRRDTPDGRGSGYGMGCGCGRTY